MSVKGDNGTPVGGVAELPDVAQGAGSWPCGNMALAVGAVAGIVALVAGGWYARRRWGR